MSTHRKPNRLHQRVARRYGPLAGITHKQAIDVVNRAINPTTPVEATFLHLIGLLKHWPHTDGQLRTLGLGAEWARPFGDPVLLLASECVTLDQATELWTITQRGRSVYDSRREELDALDSSLDFEEYTSRWAHSPEGREGLRALWKLVYPDVPGEASGARARPLVARDSLPDLARVAENGGRSDSSWREIHAGRQALGVDPVPPRILRSDEPLTGRSGGIVTDGATSTTLHSFEATVAPIDEDRADRDWLLRDEDDRMDQWADLHKSFIAEIQLYLELGPHTREPDGVASLRMESVLASGSWTLEEQQMRRAMMQTLYNSWERFLWVAVGGDRRLKAMDALQLVSMRVTHRPLTRELYDRYRVSVSNLLPGAATLPSSELIIGTMLGTGHTIARVAHLESRHYGRDPKDVWDMVMDQYRRELRRPVEDPAEHRQPADVIRRYARDYGVVISEARAQELIPPVMIRDEGSAGDMLRAVRSVADALGSGETLSRVGYDEFCRERWAGVHYQRENGSLSRMPSSALVCELHGSWHRAVRAAMQLTAGQLTTGPR